MNHWKETVEVLSRVSALRASGDGHRAALATVVQTVGSAYRRPGAKLLVLGTGDTIGSVSGGCLEADVREVARAVMDSGQPVLRRYDTTDETDAISSLGLGCRGIVDVFVQPATRGPLASILEPLQRLLAGDAPIAVATMVGGAADASKAVGAMMAVPLSGSDMLHSPIAGTLGQPDLDTELLASLTELPCCARPAVRDFGTSQVFIDIWRPPPHLVICGAGSDARPIVTYAANAGFRVTVLDHREGLLQQCDFPDAMHLARATPHDPAIALPPAGRALAVVKTHSLTHDRAWVRRFLELGLPYIGVLGPKERTDRILSDIGAETNWPGCRGRVFGPVGLDLGADGPQQIAISIVAELLAFVSHREPQHLWQRDAPIHAG
jgi:xanthine dehydrogenase accessory factor